LRSWPETKPPKNENLTAKFQEHHVNAIGGQLSLRPPQRHSLEVLDWTSEIVLMMKTEICPL